MFHTIKLEKEVPMVPITTSEMLESKPTKKQDLKEKLKLMPENI